MGACSFNRNVKWIIVHSRNVAKCLAHGNIPNKGKVKLPTSGHLLLLSVITFDFGGAAMEGRDSAEN